MTSSAGAASQALSVAERERRVLELCGGEADPAYRRRAAWALARLDPPPGARVIEVGMGAGSLLLLLARVHAVRAVGVDVDPARVLLARRCGYLGAAVVADAAALPFRDGSFSRGLACEVLEHLEDDRGALAELKRVIAAGGRVAVTVPHARYPASWDPLAFVLERLGVQPPRRGLYVGIWFGHHRLYTRKLLRAVATASGWRVSEDTLLTRGSFPFAHFLLYGVGKRMLDRGVVGGKLGAAVGRTAAPASLPPPLHPLGAAIRAFRWCDERAERRATAKTPAVHVAAVLEQP
jgi:SAM-dependent methyltransferase